MKYQVFVECGETSVGELVDREHEYRDEDGYATQRVDERTRFGLGVALGPGPLAERVAEESQHEEHDRRGHPVDMSHLDGVTIAVAGKESDSKAGHGGDLAQHHLENGIAVVREQ